MPNPEKKYDFSGYATKVGLKCSDGRTILADAFEKNDGGTVPLVWMHMRHEPENILGHAHLENRKDGVYAYCSFNDSEKAKAAKEAVKHGDIKSLSIFANSLVEKGNDVIHGSIKEVSLVIAGANPAAFIDNITFQHSDGSTVEDDTEAVISALDPLEYAGPLDNNTATIKHNDDEETIGDVFEKFSEKEKSVVYAMIASAIESAQEGGELQQSDIKGDTSMKKNIFDKSKDTTNDKGPDKKLTHSEFLTIVSDAQRCGSLKEAFIQHDYGIQNIDYLFPDAKTVTSTPTFIKRDTEWVTDVFDGAHHSPFSRIKSLAADITADEARAKGYIKGKEKVDEVIALLKRSTNPTTVYKKQKLDRDDIVDITDMDVVAWLKLEMRMMLKEEIARAQLVGDGRNVSSDDKINESNIRPIYKDDALYSHRVIIKEESNTSETIDSIILSRKQYKGSGNPKFYSTPDIIGDMLLLKDSTGRRLYNTLNDLAAALRVSKIVEVPVLENISRTVDEDTVAELLGIIVNMQDYYLGADKGGAMNMFDDFDIDYNQYKYLIETRCSGALVLPYSALVIEKLKTK